MASSGRGYLLIFNVEHERTGSEVDTFNLANVFRKMGAEVPEPIIDPTGKVVKKEMRKLMEKDFTDYSYIAVAYFSHGTEDDIVLTASDKELINAQKNILIPLGNIPSLNGKLKWLIMQNCRGSYDFLKLKPEGPVPLVKYPKYYAKFFATSPGMKAYRTKYGSFFINALCKRLEEEYKDLDIMSIMANVKEDVKEECEQYEKFSTNQTPEAEINFPGKIFYVTSGFKDN